MSTTPLFVNGQQASAAAFRSALEVVQALGSNVLQILTSAQTDTLVEFNRRLESINGRRTRSSRITSPEQAAKFVVSDFTDIDQADTIATVRADSAVVNLKERAVPAEAVIRSNTFTANEGSIEALDASQTIMRVSTFDGSIPTGTFNITLVTALTLNHFVIDVVATPSTPTITVSVSTDGITFTTASQVAINGYVINVWLPSTLVKFIQIQITPALPDELNGDSYTFGITNFSAQSTGYYLRSDFLSKIVQFSAKSEYVVFNATVDPNIQYYLSVWADGNPIAPFVEIASGDAVQLGTLETLSVTTSIGSPYLLASLPADLYPSTLTVSEAGVVKEVALGLLPTDPNLIDMVREYVTAVPTSIGYSLRLLNATANYNPPRTFVVSYVYGPQLVNVQLKARLTTNDSATTPIFTGASLDEQ